MDFLKGIGDFFSGWFGGKKRKRIQDEMSAVGEQAYQHAKQATPEQAQPQITPAQPAAAQIQAPAPQEQPKPTDLSEANQQARQLVHRPMSDQARFNQMRRGGMGHMEATRKIQAERDAINRRIHERQEHQRAEAQQKTQKYFEEKEQELKAIDSNPEISQRQKDAARKSFDQFKRKTEFVGGIENAEKSAWVMDDYTRYSNIAQRIREANSLGRRIYEKTGDLGKAQEVIRQQLAHSDEMTRLEDEEKGYRDTLKTMALATQIPRDVVKAVGRYGTKLTTSGLEALGNMTNNQALANAARQGQQVLDEAVFNKLDTEYDNQLIKGLTGGVTDLGMDLVTGKAAVGALNKAGVLGKITQSAGKASQVLNKQGKLSGLVGKGVQAGLGSPEAIASTATALFRHYPQNYNEVYNDARAKGVDHHQANILAHSNAVINAGIEKMNLDLSGWFKASGATPNRGFQAIKRAVGEGAEEWTQTMSTYAIKSIYSNIDWNKAMSEANESGLMGVAVGGIADQINAHLPKVLHKIDQEVDHKINPALQPITNALVKVELKKQITKAVQPDSQILTEAMRLNDEAVKFKINSNEQINTDPQLSQAQESFFKESKIRDDNGNLKPMHHGTSARFNQFSPESIEQDNLGRGFYFTDNEAIANSYANRRTNERGGEPRVMETFLNVKKPFDLNHQPREIALDYLTHYFSKNGESNENATKQANEFLDSIVNDGDVIDDNYNVVFSTAEPEFQDWVKSKGYDGLIVPGKDKASGLKGDAVVVFKPNQIKYTNNSNPTNNPDMRYKISQKSTEIQSSLDELKARHFQLTGDNDIAFNAFAEAIQDIGNIEGYYDPKTNTVHIGELAEYVLNHEVVHKTLRKHLELRPEIMQATADKFGIDNIIDEYNQKGYGEQAVNGHTLDASQPKDVRLAVEEKVADEFNTYLDQYQKGRANYYANKVGLSQTIRAWFDRIIEGLKEFFGQADKIKQFYAQLETGKFSTDDNIGALERTVSRLEDSIAYKRSPDAAKRALAGFNMVKNGWRKQATLTQLTADSAERYRQTTGLAVSDNAKLVLTNDTINHLRNSGHLTGEGVRGRIDRNPLTDADIANIHEVFNNPDEIKLIGDGRLGKRISVSKTVSKSHRLGVDLISDGTDFYVVTYFNKSRSPQQVQASSSEGAAELNPLRPRPERSSEAYTNNIPQTDDNIKYKLSDKAQEVSDFYYNDHQSAAQLRQNLIDQLWQANKKGQGVDHIWHEAENALDDTYMVRASNNSPFYSEYFAANGKKPTKAGITAIVDEMLGIGNDYLTPNMTAQMWEDIAYNLGDIDGIANAYRRLLNKQEMRPETTKEAIQKAIKLRQSEQDFVNLANGVNQNNAMRSYNELSQRRAGEQQAAHEKAEANSLSDDEATKRKIMTHNLRPEHKALETAPYQVLEIYDALQKDLKRAGQNIAISDKNLNKEDVGKFKQYYKQILNEMTKLADGEVRRQRLLEAGTQIQKDLANWQKGDGATFPVLDGAISTNFLNRRAPSFSEIQNQISQWTGLNNDQSKDYLSKMLKRTGYEVDNDTIINMAGANMKMSDEELDLLKKTNKKHKLTKNKSRQIYSDKMIQALADKAADDGRTYQMIYTTNKDTNAAGILSQLGEDGDYEPTTYSPEDHYIYKGAVYQRNSNKFLGYLIQITPSAEKDGGIGQIKVWDGNTYTSSNIDFSKLQGGYDTRKNTALNLEQAAGDDVSLLAGLNAVLVDPVRQGEAKLKQEAVEVAKSLNDYEAAIKKLVGRRKSKDAMFDLVLFIEPPQSDDSGKKVDRVQYLSNAEATLRQKYGQKTFDKMVEAKQYIRTLYDNLLERENSQRLKYGMPLIKRRQDYLSHYVELSANADPVHDNLGGNLMRDIFGKQQRGSIPTVMQGLTHDTKVKKKYAGYEKHRLTDNNKPLNAFDAVRTYARTSLYNIHMMDAIAGIRGFETAIKAYEQISSLKPSHQAKLLFGDAPLDYDNKKLSNFTKFIQEHANIVAGKSSSADREALASDDGAKSLARWRKLQQITGLAKIAGNVGSFVMQPVNQGVVVAELAGEKAGLSSYVKAWGSLLADNTAVAGVRGKLFGSNIEAVWEKSNFLKSRYTDASGLSVLNSKAEKLINGIGKKTEFLGVLEQISTTQGWTAYYHQARAAGKTEAQAILIADHKANKTLTGRGIGDGAHIYNDTKAAALRQFTRETNDVWRLLTTSNEKGGWNARQTLVFLAAAYGLNELMKSLRGSKATADPVAAIINELKEISDGKNALAASLDAVRGVSGEVANMHPGAQVLLAIMPDNARKMIFGKNSEIGRYGMKPAVTSIIGDSFNAAEHALSGRANKAGQSIVGMLPFGGQIKKTWEGLEAVNQGYTTNFSGRPKQEVDRTLGNVIRGTLFGKTGLSGSENSSGIKNRQKEYDLKQRLKKHGVNLKNVDDWSASGDMETDKKVQADLFKYKMGDDYKIHKMTNEERKKAVISGAISKQKLDEVDQKARSIKQKLGMEVKEPDKYQAAVNKLKLERDYLDKAGYEQAEDRASLNQQLELAEFKLKLSKNESDRLILESYDRMSAQGFKRFTKNDLRRFAQRQANPQDFWGKLLDLDQQQYQITGKYKLHNQNGEPDTIEQTARGRGRRKSGKINFNSGVDFSAISTKARSVGQSIKSPARGAMSYQISNNAFTYQPMSIRRSAPRLPKYSKKR